MIKRHIRPRTAFTTRIAEFFYQVPDDGDDRNDEDQGNKKVSHGLTYLPMIRCLLIFTDGRISDPMVRDSLLNPVIA